LFGVSQDDFCQQPGHPRVGAGPRSPRAAWIPWRGRRPGGRLPGLKPKLARRRPVLLLGGGRIPLRPHGFSAKAKVRRVTMVVMTEATPEQPSETTAAAEPPARWDGRWDKSHRRGGRPFRLAAVVVALAGIVFIIAVIFWSGFILGACEGGGGGHHHRHGGGGSGQEERGDSKRDNGMTPYGVVIEQTVPSAGFAA
jgi:hypothetical protein